MRYRKAHERFSFFSPLHFCDVVRHLLISGNLTIAPVPLFFLFSPPPLSFPSASTLMIARSPGHPHRSFSFFLSPFFPQVRGEMFRTQSKGFACNGGDAPPIFFLSLLPFFPLGRPRCCRDDGRAGRCPHALCRIGMTFSSLSSPSPPLRPAIRSSRFDDASKLRRTFSWHLSPFPSPFFPSLTPPLPDRKGAGGRCLHFKAFFPFPFPSSSSRHSGSWDEIRGVLGQDVSSFFFPPPLLACFNAYHELIRLPCRRLLSSFFLPPCRFAGEAHRC